MLELEWTGKIDVWTFVSFRFVSFRFDGAFEEVGAGREGVEGEI